MLTPAVRAETHAWADGHTADALSYAAAVAGAEWGYCRGYQARPHREPYPNPLAVEQQRVLAPYLPEGIEVYHPGTGGYGLLRGLPYALSSRGEDAVIADVQWYAVGDADGDIYARPGVLLPVLWAFALLGEQANGFSTDATAHAAMMELASALQGGGTVTEIVDALYFPSNDRSRIWLQYEDEDGDYCDAYLWDDGSAQDANEEAIQMSDWLRQAGFAVGLRADQYQRRVAGHDYRTGAPLAEGKEVCGG